MSTLLKIYDHLKSTNFHQKYKKFGKFIKKQAGAVQSSLDSKITHFAWSNINIGPQKLGVKKGNLIKIDESEKIKFTIFEELSFFLPRFYISGICGPILMFDHAKWVIFEFQDKSVMATETSQNFGGDQINLPF